jgi:hypothetical protein
MEGKQQIRIWAGERKLLPIEKTATCYRYHCVSGEGYLRIMSSANRVESHKVMNLLYRVKT